MELAYELIENNRTYFLDETMFGGRTFFEIDMALCKSKNARGDIQKLVDEFKSQKNFDFINSDFFAKNLVEDQYYNEVNKIAVALSQYFNGYGNRLSALDDLFKEIMSLKIE